MNAHDTGDLVRISGAFTDAAGVAVDPTTVALTYEKPDGSQATVTYAGAQVIKLAVGSYYYDLSVDQAGRWSYRWVTTGTGQAAELGKFWARPSPLTGTDP